MWKVVDQALWMVEQGAGRIDNYAEAVLTRVLRDLSQGVVKIMYHPDVRFIERAKAETLIGPPPAPEPIATYAVRYCQQMDKDDQVMGHGGESVTIHPPDVDVLR